MATLAIVWSEWRVFSRGKLLSRVKIMSLRNRAVAESGTQLGMALGPKEFRGVIGSFPAIPGFGGRFTEVADATHLEGKLCT